MTQTDRQTDRRPKTYFSLFCVCAQEHEILLLLQSLETDEEKRAVGNPSAVLNLLKMVCVCLPACLPTHKQPSVCVCARVCAEEGVRIVRLHVG